MGKTAAEPGCGPDELSRSHVSITEQQLKELGVVNVGLESTHNMFEDQVGPSATPMTKSDPYQEELNDIIIPCLMEASGTHTHTQGTHGELLPGRSTANQL